MICALEDLQNAAASVTLVDNRPQATRYVCSGTGRESALVCVWCVRDKHPLQMCCNRVFPRIVKLVLGCSLFVLLHRVCGELKVEELPSWRFCLLTFCFGCRIKRLQGLRKLQAEGASCSFRLEPHTAIVRWIEVTKCFRTTTTYFKNAANVSLAYSFGLELEKNCEQSALSFSTRCHLMEKVFMKSAEKFLI